MAIGGADYLVRPRLKIQFGGSSLGYLRFFIDALFGPSKLWAYFQLFQKPNCSNCGRLVDVQQHFAVLIAFAGRTRIVCAAAAAQHTLIKNPCLDPDCIFHLGNTVDHDCNRGGSDIIAIDQSLLQRQMFDAQLRYLLLKDSHKIARSPGA